ncbi:transposase [Dyadobacter subterraneus]|uniref:transposase n=1 Tax=Dyadobacter subterraneus TaxID=2773304 RepID=UPI00286E429E|nr:transposase [Dyadobacter subterraneus]
MFTNVCSGGFRCKRQRKFNKKEFRAELFEYIAGIIKGKNQKPIIVNGVGDHVHIFIGLRPSMSVSDLVRDIKNNSSNFINSKNFVKGKFSWQEGFGPFTYGQSQIDSVFKYISNQEAHHQKKTFKEEYIDMLAKFQVKYDEKYLFDWIE